MSCVAVAHRHTPGDIFMQVGFGLTYSRTARGSHTRSPNRRGLPALLGHEAVARYVRFGAWLPAARVADHPSESA
jgi:hypothetical protein